MNAYLVDANLLVRILAQDDPKQSPASTELFERAESREVELHLDVLAIAECVYVLTGHYNRSRSEVTEALDELLQNPGLQTKDAALVRDALRRFSETKVDFPDAWLAAGAAATNRPVASFDRDLDKFKDIQRFEPGS